MKYSLSGRMIAAGAGLLLWAGLGVDAAECGAASETSGAKRRVVLQPEVKSYQRVPGVAFAVKELPVVHGAGETLEAAAGEVRAEGLKSVYAGGELPPKGVFIAVRDTDFGKKLVASFDLDVPAKKQGYALKASQGIVAIVGFDAVGALYGAETFRQMAVSGEVEPAIVRDWPDILYRGAMSVGRGLWLYSNGCKDRRPLLKAAIDEMARMKLNMMIDHFHVRPNSDEKTFAFWREINHYATVRGIYSRNYGSTSVYLRHNYPKEMKFTDWKCVRSHRSWEDNYYCWSDDALTEQAANNYADFILKAGMEKGILTLHPVDAAIWQDPEDWSKRCEKCKARWNDHERWKASVNQFNIWTRVLRKRLPEAIIGSCTVPYHFGWLGKPESERSPKWYESSVDYWRNVAANMEDREFFFSSWICTPDCIRKARELIPHRQFHFCDTFPQTSGIFHAFNRRACTVWEEGAENMFGTSGGDCRGCWESMALLCECAWNKDAPCAEPYDGGTYYDPLTDHAGAGPVFSEALPRICETFWGKAVAPYLLTVMGSGIMPNYLKDPSRHVQYWNQTRRDPAFDPLTVKKDVVKPTVQPIEDTPDLMAAQVAAAEVCVKALAEAESKALALPPVQLRYYMKFAKEAPLWLATARARYAVRHANELVRQGKNAEALAFLDTARRQVEADYDVADATQQRLLSQPDALNRNEKWPFGREVAMKMLARTEASARVVLAPRKIGREVKVGVVKDGGYVGIMKYLDCFANIRAETFDSLDLATLDRFDCVILVNKAYDKDDFFSNLKTYVEKGGGGVYFEGPLCGHKRWNASTPFPDVVETSPDRIDNFDREMRFADGRNGKTMYIDFFALTPGEKGEVRAFGPDGKTPMAVRGEAGAGKVFFNGTFNVKSVGGTYASDKTSELEDANAELVLEAIEYFTDVRLRRKGE